jgi:hypothetical protein
MTEAVVTAVVTADFLIHEEVCSNEEAHLPR